MMSNYKKKTQEVEGMGLTAFNLEEVWAWLGTKYLGHSIYQDDTTTVLFTIATNRGEVTAGVGSMIVKEGEEFSVYSMTDFEKEYDAS